MLGDAAGRGGAVGGEAVHEGGTHEVEAVGPAIVTERPQDLDAVPLRGLEHRARRSE